MSDLTEWIYGSHTCEKILERHPERIFHVYYDPQRKESKRLQLLSTIKQLGITMSPCSKQELLKKTDTDHHQGIAFHCRASQLLNTSFLKKYLNDTPNPFFLILDGVTDPHNLGACIRSAEAAGVDALIIPKNRAASLNSTSRKVACGAAETLPIISVTNLAQCLTLLKSEGVWLYGAAGEAEKTLFETSLTGPIALVLGNEAQGLRRLTRDHCDQLIRIPMTGATESLNVSVATGVCLFEAVRQRQSNS
jgi:23S rRNA (guanosine2251-2'-O)-methyltransferase